MTRINVDVPDNLHSRSKATASLREESLKDFVEHALDKEAMDLTEEQIEQILNEGA
jgi:predicted HicB family RNase H-like nuclease